jgi:hypothetical protein
VDCHQCETSPTYYRILEARHSIVLACRKLTFLLTKVKQRPAHHVSGLTHR